MIAPGGKVIDRHTGQIDALASMNRTRGSRKRYTPDHARQTTQFTRPPDMFGVMPAVHSKPPVLEPSSDPDTAAALIEANRRFYDGLWSDARLIEPEKFNTWPLISELIAKATRRLEIAPGLRPRLPLQGTHFVDISFSALAKLRGRGGNVALGAVSSIPLADAGFDLVCALDIVEHVQDDGPAWAEIARVAAPGAAVLISTPLHEGKWTPFDDFVGHYRRYEPDRLLAKLAEHGLVVEQSAVYGMQLKSSLLLNLAMWWLTNRREQAMWWYNRVWFPIGLRLEKKLALTKGLIDLAAVDEILLICRKK